MAHDDANQPSVPSDTIIAARDRAIFSDTPGADAPGAATRKPKDAGILSDLIARDITATGVAATRISRAYTVAPHV